MEYEVGEVGRSLILKDCMPLAEKFGFYPIKMGKILTAEVTRLDIHLTKILLELVQKRMKGVRDWKYGDQLGNWQVGKKWQEMVGEDLH